MFKMIMQINNLGVNIVIDTIQEKIFIIQDKTNSEKLFDMVFKSMLNKINIDLRNYKVEYC